MCNAHYEVFAFCGHRVLAFVVRCRARWTSSCRLTETEELVRDWCPDCKGK
jgi:hypothetical protein